jgi:hypothetical protein
VDGDPPIPDDPYSAGTFEPVMFEPGQLNALTPMGQADSLGAFGRGLGPRRVKVLIALMGTALIVLAIFSR